MRNMAIKLAMPTLELDQLPEAVRPRPAVQTALQEMATASTWDDAKFFTLRRIRSPEDQVTT